MLTDRIHLILPNGYVGYVTFAVEKRPMFDECTNTRLSEIQSERNAIAMQRYAFQIDMIAMLAGNEFYSSVMLAYNEL